MNYSILRTDAFSRHLKQLAKKKSFYKKRLPENFRRIGYKSNIRYPFRQDLFQDKNEHCIKKIKVKVVAQSNNLCKG